MLVAVAYIIVTLLMLIMLLKKGLSKLMLLYFMLELYFSAVALAFYMG